MTKSDADITSRFVAGSNAVGQRAPYLLAIRCSRLLDRAT